MSENWRPVPGYDGLYEVSDDGQVRSVSRIITRSFKSTRRSHQQRIPSILAKQYLVRTGHLYVSLYTPGVGNKRHRVHRLVLAAFVGPCPEEHEGCHINGEPADNRLENLYWGTRSDNVRDMIRHGRGPKRSGQCGKGHLFDDANTRIRPDGAQSCRACARELANSKYQAAKERGIRGWCQNRVHDRCTGCACDCHGERVAS